MEVKDFIPVIQLCEHYCVEISFFKKLREFGLIEITSIEKTLYLHQDNLGEVEKIIRIHRELNVNIEGIDVVLNLLQKVNDLQNELNKVQNRLRLYENDYQ